MCSRRPSHYTSIVVVKGPQPFLLIDDGHDLFHAANRALERLGRWRPLLLIPQYTVAQRYILDSVEDGRPPAAIIIRAHDAEPAPMALLDWLDEQPHPLRSTEVLVITDDVVNECQGSLDEWMENAFREILQLPVRGRSSDDGLQM